MKFFGKIAPLPASFMMASIVGFLVSYMLVLPKFFNFGAAFMILFGMMFIAAFISMTKAPVSEKELK